MDWLTTQEAGDFLGVTQNHVRLLIKEGKLQAQKFGRVWMVSRQSVEDYAGTYRKPGPKPRNTNNT